MNLDNLAAEPFTHVIDAKSEVVSYRINCGAVVLAMDCVVKETVRLWVDCGVV